MKDFIYKTEFNCTREELFTWHAQPGAFERLTPYWESVKINELKGHIQDGDYVKLAIELGPLSLNWHLIHDGYQENERFCDLQAPGLFKGPFKYWKHEHLFYKIDNKSSVLEDRIKYKSLLAGLDNSFINKKLERLFKFRHTITKNDIAASQFNNKENKKMKILIAGSSGLVGTELVSFLRHQGHEVTRLTRSKNNSQETLFWDPALGVLDETDLDGFDAIINLAGENIANKRWTKKQKEKIRNSRVKSTSLLSQAMAKLKNPPEVFICASAIGFYGDRPMESLTEESLPSKGDFLADTCVEWEKSTQAAVDAGIRVINARFGIILSPKGGAMSKLLLPFQLGLGGIIGDGEQYMSWIALDDVVYGINYLIQDQTISGPVNFTSPEPVTNEEFTKTLGKVLDRPTIFPVPAFAAKLAFGEMADALLLCSAKVQPIKLIASRFKFAFPDLESALRHLLGR